MLDWLNNVFETREETESAHEEEYVRQSQIRYAGLLKKPFTVRAVFLLAAGLVAWLLILVPTLTEQSFQFHYNLSDPTPIQFNFTLKKSLFKCLVVFQPDSTRIRDVDSYGRSLEGEEDIFDQYGDSFMLTDQAGVMQHSLPIFSSTCLFSNQPGCEAQEWHLKENLFVRGVYSLPAGEYQLNVRPSHREGESARGRATVIVGTQAFVDKMALGFASLLLVMAAVALGLVIGLMEKPPEAREERYLEEIA